MTTPVSATFTLHTYPFSSCAQRILMACALKNIIITLVHIDMDSDSHLSSEYMELNPAGTIPTLTIIEADSSKTVITQSVAILEYLEERFAGMEKVLQLLPELEGGRKERLRVRARVREIVGVITTDLFPMGNSGLTEKVRPLVGSKDELKRFVHGFFEKGFGALDRLIGNGEGYCVGVDLTLADACLGPMVWMAERYGFKVARFRNVERVYERLMELDSFRGARPEMSGRGKAREGKEQKEREEKAQIVKMGAE